MHIFRLTKQNRTQFFFHQEYSSLEISGGDAGSGDRGGSAGSRDACDAHSRGNKDILCSGDDACGDSGRTGDPRSGDDVYGKDGGGDGDSGRGDNRDGKGGIRHSRR
ncbi:hypothetical protein NPIL_159121 [Nephila pilipes]|uniref:Uncharacterized protein n=1 Tax=Nephila pilipes TaxID=299642 RepID=A0A8X6TGF0_NEPPI|nr:hypothetical protein NPIL_544931 [Nephila pilipes]GFT28912.1 hypothetical protein NPIL_159121 [Nephila pilipes]